MIPRLLAAVLALAAPKGSAEKAAPVQVDAADVHYAFQRREVLFTGKPGKPVTLTRDDAKLTCAKLLAKNDEAGQIVTATCEGAVRFVRAQRVVTCETATYENAAARVTCDGNAVLRDGGTEARGVRLVYELRSDEVKLEGGGDRPVRITLPGEEVEARKKQLAERRKERAK